MIAVLLILYRDTNVQYIFVLLHSWYIIYSGTTAVFIRVICRYSM